MSSNPRINMSQFRSPSTVQPLMCRTQRKNKFYLLLFRTKIKNLYLLLNWCYIISNTKSNWQIDTIYTKYILCDMYCPLPSCVMPWPSSTLILCASSFLPSFYLSGRTIIKYIFFPDLATRLDMPIQCIFWKPGEMLLGNQNLRHQ